MKKEFIVRFDSIEAETQKWPTMLNFYQENRIEGLDLIFSINQDQLDGYGEGLTKEILSDIKCHGKAYVTMHVTNSIECPNCGRHV